MAIQDRPFEYESAPISRQRPESVACETLWKRAHLDSDSDSDSVFGVEIAIYMYIKWRREVAGDGAIDFVA